MHIFSLFLLLATWQPGIETWALRSTVLTTAAWGNSFFPGGSEVKASACNAGDLGSIPGWGRSPGEGNDNPLQYSCLGNPMDRGAWWAQKTQKLFQWAQKSPSGHKKLDMTEHACMPDSQNSKFVWTRCFLCFMWSEFGSWTVTNFEEVVPLLWRSPQKPAHPDLSLLVLWGWNSGIEASRALVAFAGCWASWTPCAGWGQAGERSDRRWLS